MKPSSNGGPGLRSRPRSGTRNARSTTPTASASSVRPDSRRGAGTVSLSGVACGGAITGPPPPASTSVRPLPRPVPEEPGERPQPRHEQHLDEQAAHEPGQLRDLVEDAA